MSVSDVLANREAPLRWNNRTPPCATWNLWFIAHIGHGDDLTLQQRWQRDAWRISVGLMPSGFYTPKGEIR